MLCVTYPMGVLPAVSVSVISLCVCAPGRRTWGATASWMWREPRPQSLILRWALVSEHNHFGAHSVCVCRCVVCVCVCVCGVGECCVWVWVWVSVSECGWVGAVKVFQVCGFGTVGMTALECGGQDACG